MDITKKDLNLNLVLQKINTWEWCTEQKKQFLLHLAELYWEDVTPFLKMYTKLDEEGIIFEDEKAKVSFNISGDNYEIFIGERMLLLSREQAIIMLEAMINLLEDILPLGTVVELNPDKMIEGSKSKMKIVITQRLVAPSAVNCYYEYMGVGYPIGNYKNQVVNFTPELINRVIHVGYTDNQELIFIYLTKKEFIVEKNKYSIMFSTEEERRKLANQIKGDGANG